MKIIKSKVIPVERDDVDTDLIIPADYLKITDKRGLGQHLFERIAKDINLESYSGRSIMIAGSNFGCGSSREHAAWALYDFGVRVVIASSFADIFYNNALKNGILPLVCGGGQELFAYEGELEVDLEKQNFSYGANTFSFEIDAYSKTCLIEEIDDLDYLFENIEAIKAFDEQRRKNLFFDLSKL
jgi:3-isopropylmalate/(R)-2-methylmalate dehydratase small subunit